jgi:hypothetical protein
VRALVELRAEARRAAKRVLAGGGCGARDEALALLAACVRVRDYVLPALGWALIDEAGSDVLRRRYGCAPLS